MTPGICCQLQRSWRSTRRDTWGRSQSEWAENELYLQGPLENKLVRYHVAISLSSYYNTSLIPVQALHPSECTLERQLRCAKHHPNSLNVKGHSKCALQSRTIFGQSVVYTMSTHLTRQYPRMLCLRLLLPFFFRQNVIDRTPASNGNSTIKFKHWNFT